MHLYYMQTCKDSEIKLILLAANSNLLYIKAYNVS